jgi:lactoylglutathione lyase
MKIEHIAIWTKQIEVIKDYYIQYFGGITGKIYNNPSKLFTSYFVSFDSGARLEIMTNPDIIENKNNIDNQNHIGLTHIAIEVGSMKEVDNKADELRKAGFPILDGPRKTGDGYYEFTSIDPDKNRIEVTTKYV